VAQIKNVLEQDFHKKQCIVAFKIDSWSTQSTRHDKGMGVVRLFSADMSGDHAIRWKGISKTATSKSGRSRIDDGPPELANFPRQMYFGPFFFYNFHLFHVCKKQEIAILSYVNANFENVAQERRGQDHNKLPSKLWRKLYEFL